MDSKVKGKGKPKSKSRVTFSRFEQYFIYDWVSPVNGFQTRIELFLNKEQNKEQKERN